MSHLDLIPISGTEEEITKSYARIVQALTDDNPLLYYLNQSTMEFAKDANGNFAVIPQYFFSAENVAKYNHKIQDAANQLIYDLKLTEGSDFEKVKKVHDYMCVNAKYDNGGSNQKDLSRFIAAHNIIGVFAHKSAQCDGIVKVAKVLLNAVDVRCIFVTGKAKGDDSNMAAHGWNIVNIDGTPYQLDITMDIGAGTDGFIAYDYFNVTDAQMRKNHVFSTGYPRCSAAEENYFVKNGLVFSSKKKLQDYISKQVKAGETMMYFKLAGKLKVAEIYQEMMNFGYQILCDMAKRM
mgnify:CR=1 FL=1